MTHDNLEWAPTKFVASIYGGRRVIHERDVYGTGLPRVSCTHGLDLSGLSRQSGAAADSLEGAGGIGGLLARSTLFQYRKWTIPYYYHADGNGNITCLIGTNQSVMASYRYDPFGNTLAKSGTLADANTYRFSSKEVDINSGMYYYGYRFYDPTLQGWLNRDPLREWGGLNLYAFCANNPVYYFDPLGMSWWNPLSWFGHDRDKEGPAEAAQKTAECAKKACEQRANKSVSSGEPVEGGGLGGGVATGAGVGVEVETGIVQAGPAITAIEYMKIMCKKCYDCLASCDQSANCDPPCKKCRDAKIRMSKPIKHL